MIETLRRTMIEQRFLRTMIETLRRTMVEMGWCATHGGLSNKQGEQLSINDFGNLVVDDDDDDDDDDATTFAKSDRASGHGRLCTSPTKG